MPGSPAELRQKLLPAVSWRVGDGGHEEAANSGEPHPPLEQRQERATSSVCCCRRTCRHVRRRQAQSSGDLAHEEQHRDRADQG